MSDPHEIKSAPHTEHAKLPCCEVCGRQDAMVSALVGFSMSIARCRPCLIQDRLPWHVLIGECLCLGPKLAADTIQDSIDATLAFYGKNEADLWKAVHETEAEYNEMMSNQGDPA